MEALDINIPNDIIDAEMQKCLSDRKFLDLWLLPPTND